MRIWNYWFPCFQLAILVYSNVYPWLNAALRFARSTRLSLERGTSKLKPLVSRLHQMSEWHEADAERTDELPWRDVLLRTVIFSVTKVYDGLKLHVLFASGVRTLPRTTQIFNNQDETKQDTVGSADIRHRTNERVRWLVVCVSVALSLSPTGKWELKEKPK